MGASLRWLRPLSALLLFGIAAVILHRELEHLDPREVLAHIYAIPFWTVLGALVLAALSYWLLSFYDLLALRYIGKRISYGRVMFTSYIAYAFGHNLFLAGVTGAAVRLRLYAPSGLTAIDVAAVSVFCTVMTALGASVLAGAALLLDPSMAEALRLGPWAAAILGTLLLAAVAAYVLWGSLHRRPIEIRGWAFRGPGAPVSVAQVVLGAVDFVLAGAVLWVLLPPETPMGLAAFAGLYALAFAVGILSHVPGGLGVFEAVLVFALPQLDIDELLGALLAYRAVYYLAPLLTGAVLFLFEEVRAQRTHIARAQAIASTYVRPIAPQIAATLTFIAGAVLMVSGVTPAIDDRLVLLTPVVPLPLFELSHLAGSLVGLGLVVLASPLRRRVTTAYHITLALLYAGIVVSLLKGLGIEQASFLMLVMAVLVLGRDAFYRPAFLLSQRFTPGWAASVLGVIAATVWIGWLAHRQVEYSDELWWTFAFNADAPRMLRASLLMSVAGGAWLLLGLLRPGEPDPAPASPSDRERARAVLVHADHVLANAALTGDKQLLFSEDGSAFVMYQVSGRSWVALGNPTGPRAQADELAWRLKELAERHHGSPVFYQIGPERLALYAEQGLAPLRLGDEARVPLASFSLDDDELTELGKAHAQALQHGAAFEIVPAHAVAGLLPRLQRISADWFERTKGGRKRASAAAIDPDYLCLFDLALIRRADQPTAFANIWTTAGKHELAVDLMCFAADAPPHAMDFLFAELMLWGKAEGYTWFNLGMAPLADLGEHPLAPAWHRFGSVGFRHGEHFASFKDLRAYKVKFNPVWEPRYLVARAELGLPRILRDVSRVSGGNSLVATTTRTTTR